MKVARRSASVPCHLPQDQRTSVFLERFLTSFTTGPTRCLPHALFTPRWPSGLNLDESHEQGYCGLLYCRRRSVPSPTADAGGIRGEVVIHPQPCAALHQPSTPPPVSLLQHPCQPPLSLTLISSFFLNISASFLFPPPLAQCNYGNGFSPPLS